VVNGRAWVRFRISPSTPARSSVAAVGLLIRSGGTGWRPFSGMHAPDVSGSEPADLVRCHSGCTTSTARWYQGRPRVLEEFAVHIRGDEVIVARRS
jgi:hypothetical protein